MLYIFIIFFYSIAVCIIFLQYSGWTSQAKALYVGVHVTFVFQSRYDTVVELVGIKDADEEPEKRKEEDEP